VAGNHGGLVDRRRGFASPRADEWRITVVNLSQNNGAAKSKTSRRDARNRPSRTPRRNETETVADSYEFDVDEDLGMESHRRAFHTPSNTLNERSRDQLLGSLPKNDTRGPVVHRYVLMITDNATDGLLLSQLIYWLSKSTHLPLWEESIPCKWTAQTSSELGQQLALSEDQVDKSLTRLKKRGFVQWKRKIFGGKLHRYIWLRWDRIAQAYNETKGVNSDRMQ
jgi:hypothetical protein